MQSFVNLELLRPLKWRGTVMHKRTLCGCASAGPGGSRTGLFLKAHWRLHKLCFLPCFEILVCMAISPHIHVRKPWLSDSHGCPNEWTWSKMLMCAHHTWHTQYTCISFTDRHLNGKQSVLMEGHVQHVLLLFKALQCSYGLCGFWFKWIRSCDLQDPLRGEDERSFI